MALERLHCGNGTGFTRAAAALRTFVAGPSIADQCMATLARHSGGRIALHLMAMSGDRCVRFHLAGILRELPRVAAILSLLVRTCHGLAERFVHYLGQPVSTDPGATIDLQRLAASLKPGDVLLSDGNTRIAAVVKSLTRSTWSHVSLYVGPLDNGPDPQCVVEADFAEGVRSIRLSELNARQVRVLRPIGVDDTERRQVADWVISRIGSEYDLAHAGTLARKLLLRPLSNRLRAIPSSMADGARRFICCSLLANAFALIGHPILPDPVRTRLSQSADYRNLTPGDFEHASAFEIVEPMKWQSS